MKLSFVIHATNDHILLYSQLLVYYCSSKKQGNFLKFHSKDNYVLKLYTHLNEYVQKERMKEVPLNTSPFARILNSLGID